MPTPWISAAGVTPKTEPKEAAADRLVSSSLFLIEQKHIFVIDWLLSYRLVF